jgi:hypothetical protein
MDDAVPCRRGRARHVRRSTVEPSWSLSFVPTPCPSQALDKVGRLPARQLLPGELRSPPRRSSAAARAAAFDGLICAEDEESAIAVTIEGAPDNGRGKGPRRSSMARSACHSVRASTRFMVIADATACRKNGRGGIPARGAPKSWIVPSEHIAFSRPSCAGRQVRLRSDVP